MLNASTESLLKRETERPLSGDYGTTREEHKTTVKTKEGTGTGSSSSRPDLDHRSLLSKLAWLGVESKSLKELPERLGTFFVGSVLWTIIFVTTLVVPFIMVIVGSVYIDQCPRQPMVPIFLVVGGTTTALNNGLNLIERFRKLGDATPPRTVTPIGIVTSLLNCFTVAWLIAGCIWTYGSYRPAASAGAGALYCHPGVYLLAFWLINSYFLFLLAVVITAAVSFGWSRYFTAPRVLAK